MHVDLSVQNAAADEKTSPTRFATHVARQLRTIFVSARLRILPVRSQRLLGLCWRRPGRPQRAHGATRARHGPLRERPQSVPERLATAFACPTGRPKAFWSAWASILARPGRSAWSPGTPFAFDFRTSWHCALRLAFARATAFDQQNAKKRGAFAFVLRLAARARPRDFHDFSHDLRGHVLFVAPR